MINEEKVKQIKDNIKSASILELTPKQIFNHEHILKKLQDYDIDFEKLGLYGCPSEWFGTDTELCVKELGFKLVKRGDPVVEETNFCGLCWKRALMLSEKEEEEEYLVQSQGGDELNIDTNEANEIKPKWKKEKMNFYTFIKRYEGLNEPYGDFFYDVTRDPTFPKDVQTWEELRDYLTLKGAASIVLEIAEELWVSYEMSIQQKEKNKSKVTDEKEEDMQSVTLSTPCVMLPLDVYDELNNLKQELEEYRDIGLSPSDLKRVLKALRWKEGVDLNRLIDNITKLMKILEKYK
ncbi:MAG: hypothetical protein GX969_08870 [Firmicutes bacterium]|nr:hypothetical protein [Bacillota bacterium]